MGFSREVILDVIIFNPFAKSPHPHQAKLKTLFETQKTANTRRGDYLMRVIKKCAPTGVKNHDIYTACLSGAETLKFPLCSVNVSIVYEKKSKVSKNSHRAPPALESRSALLQFSTMLAQIALFLTALSSREFRRAIEAGSIS